MNFCATCRSDPASFRRDGLGGRARRALLACALGGVALAARADGTGSVMPLPARESFGPGEMAVTPAWSVALPAGASPRLHAAVDRMLAAWSERTGLRWTRSGGGGPQGASLTLACDHPGPPIPVLGEDES
jgi:hypothetical protein